MYVFNSMNRSDYSFVALDRVFGNHWRRHLSGVILQAVWYGYERSGVGRDSGVNNGLTWSRFDIFRSLSDTTT